MLYETGRVVAVDDDGLWVETIRESTCGSCAARKGCGHSLINAISDGQRGYIRVLPGKIPVADCLVDDRVRFSIPEEVILRGSFIVYLVPVVCMLLAALAAVRYLEGNQDVLAAMGGAAGFALGMAAVRWHASRHRHDAGFQPTLVEVIRPDICAAPGQ